MRPPDIATTTNAGSPDVGWSRSRALSQRGYASAAAAAAVQQKQPTTSHGQASSTSAEPVGAVQRKALSHTQPRRLRVEDRP